MSREAYQVPQVGGTGAGGAGGGSSSYGAGGGSQLQGSSAGDAGGGGGPLTQYLCGECAAKVQLKKGDPIRCKECGHRVLYKERTKRLVLFPSNFSCWRFGVGGWGFELERADSHRVNSLVFEVCILGVSAYERKEEDREGKEKNHADLSSFSLGIGWCSLRRDDGGDGDI